KARETASPDSVAALQTDLGTVKTGLAALGDTVAALAGSVRAIENTPEPQPVDLRLPLALSGLGEALDTGAPFARELALIRAALPDLAIPDAVTAITGSGLGSPAALEARFAAFVPGILAAKPADASASWSDQALERLKALVALRPVGAENDTTPEGLVSRVEAGLAARDYAVAMAAFEALPAPMRAAAAGIGADIAGFAATADLIGRARGAALSLAGAPS
ncbi:MAG: hypothetical protein KKH72_01630, partial [Alphaproteobacteria bacterium]|nr:hypothetical protein [Alphaproteobacteria bacterium]